MEFKKVFIPKKWKEYLEKRNLLKRFDKQVGFLKSGNLKIIDFKLREPKNEGIYYFRLNRQFRVYGVITEFFNEETKKVDFIFTVSEINNHQN